jgi:SOS-response transcriptional repressor LexA
MKDNLGSYLRSIRTARGNNGSWSLRSVARRAGISDAYLSQLETGKVTRPFPDVLKKLADALNHPYDDLLQAAGYRSRPPETPATMNIPFLQSGSPNPNCKESPSIILDRALIDNRNCFAFRITDSGLREHGISKNDIVIATPDSKIADGDLVIARIDDEIQIKRYYRIHVANTPADTIILQPCDGTHDLMTVGIRDKRVEIIGRLIKIVKDV